MEPKDWMGIAVVVLFSLWMTAPVVSVEKPTTSGILVQNEVWSGNIRLTGDVEFWQRFWWFSVLGAEAEAPPIRKNAWSL